MTNDFLIQTVRCHIQIDQVQILHMSPLKCIGRLLKLHNRSPWVEVLFSEMLKPTRVEVSQLAHTPTSPYNAFCTNLGIKRLILCATYDHLCVWHVGELDHTPVFSPRPTFSSRGVRWNCCRARTPRTTPVSHLPRLPFTHSPTPKLSFAMFLKGTWQLPYL